MTVRVLAGDCLEILPILWTDGVQVDSVACDPPYHLTSIVKRFGKAGSAPARSNGATGVYGRATKGFMGKEWDGGDVAFRPGTWQMVKRVMKPGAYLVAFSGTRTYHRMACAIEDAGFVIRDQLQWLYGSGFPKSLNIAKAIDKRRVEDLAPTRQICRFIRSAMDAKHLQSRDLVGHFDGCHPRLIDHWAARESDSQPSLPTPSQWQTLKQVLEFGDQMDALFSRLCNRKGRFGDAYLNAPIVGEYFGDPGGFNGERFRVAEGLDREPASDEAKPWAGWGTALKPACEPIVLAQKPVSESSIVANVLRHGVGGINVSDCEVPATTWPHKEVTGDIAGGVTFRANGGGGSRAAGYTDTGRWPANVLHDGSAEVSAAFARYGDVARFFYCAKASAEERMGSKHPTVKPIALMRWLTRLITPPGGLVLDPFAGSGTTGVAARAEGFDAILIEREAEYTADIRARLDRLDGKGPHSANLKSRNQGPPIDMGPMFSGNSNA